MRTSHPEGRSVESTELSISGSVDISGVLALREQLLRALDSARPIAIDASAVERADAAAIQLLYAFVLEARRRAVTVTWRDPSDALQRAARILGLEDVLLVPDGATPAPPSAA